MCFRLKLEYVLSQCRGNRSEIQYILWGSRMAGLPEDCAKSFSKRIPFVAVHKLLLSFSKTHHHHLHPFYIPLLFSRTISVSAKCSSGSKCIIRNTDIGLFGLRCSMSYPRLVHVNNRKCDVL